MKKKIATTTTTTSSSTSDYIRNLLTPENIADHNLKAIQNSIANRYSVFKGMSDRQIAESYIYILDSEITWNEIFKGSGQADLATEEELRFARLEKRAMVKLLERGQDFFPELHNDDLYVDFITKLEWDEMTDEERADEERRINEIIADCK